MSALPGDRHTRLRPDLAVVPVRSPTLPPATHTNCWILGTDELVVVDPASPWPKPQQALVHGLGGRKLRAIFLTHHHHDHVGGLGDLAARTGAPIWAHPETARLVQHRVDRLVRDGEELELDGATWRALHTPGHAPGHLCLHDEASDTVVAGDMVAGIGTIVLDPPEAHLGRYLHSLQRLLDLGPTRLLPAHGPVIEDGPALLREYIRHRHARTDQVRDTLAEHPGARPIDLVPRIYPELPMLFRPVAARQVLCHLLWMQEQGQVVPLDAAAGGAQAGADGHRWQLA